MENVLDFSFREASKIGNGIIPSYFSHPSIWNKNPSGGGNNNPTIQTGNVNQATTGGHRRLPATPKKPSTLFGKTATMAFNNISTQLPKPSSLALR